MTSPLRLVFAGTPDFAVPHLAACRRDGIDVVAVYTQPDRPAGRGRQLAESPVKAAARAAGIAVEQPATLKTVAARAQLARYAPDLMVVVAYGLLLPPRVLAMPVHGCWNVHASLLPRWRGAAPIQRAIEAGDGQTGVCLMQMDAGLDTGPVLARHVVDITPDDTGGSLHDRLAVAGAAVLGAALDALVRGALPVAVAQALAGVTYAHKLDKAQARLDWTRSASELEHQVRAFDPWPVAEAVLGGDSVRVWRACALPATAAAAPGQIVAAGAAGIDVACGNGVLRVLDLQRAGARRLAAADYLNGRPQWRAATPGNPI